MLKKWTRKTAAGLLIIWCWLLAFGGGAWAADDGWWRYGSQLSKASQQVYAQLEASEAQLLSRGDIVVFFEPPILYDDYDASVVQDAWDAFDYDHPEIFWLDVGGTINIGKGYGDTIDTSIIKQKPFVNDAGKTEQVNSHLAYYAANPRQLAADKAALAKVTASVTQGAEALTSRYEQLLYLHDWILANNVYNDKAGANLYAYPLSHKAVSGLLPDKTRLDGGPVCDGYARAFKVLCDSLGIPCVLISGTGVDPKGGSELHMWNAVQMEDGQWYAVDTTWDDSGPEDMAHQYFLVGYQTQNAKGLTFAESHLPMNSFTPGGRTFDYPILADTAYAFDSAAHETVPETPSAAEPPAAAERPEQPPAAQGFGDVAPEAWYAEVVQTATERGLMVGLADGVFGPEASLTSAQTKAVLLRVLGIETAPVAEGEPWYANVEQAALGMGLTGLGSGPEQLLTRGEMAMLLTQALAWVQVPLDVSQNAWTALAAYGDVTNLPQVQQEALAFCLERGLLVGTSTDTMSPEMTLTRAQMAALCLRLDVVLPAV